jgi:putative Holliday junction resolvase
MGRTLGLDVGTKTIGVACSDATGLLASPVRTLRRQSVAADVEVLAALLAERGADRVVVGLPYELDGSEGRSARLARQVGDALALRAQVPVVWIDERYSSVEATRQLADAGVFGSRRKAVVDQQAAVLILQSWLDHPELEELDR